MKQNSKTLKLKSLPDEHARCSINEQHKNNKNRNPQNSHDNNTLESLFGD